MKQKTESEALAEEKSSYIEDLLAQYEKGEYDSAKTRCLKAGLLVILQNRAAPAADYGGGGC